MDMPANCQKNVWEFHSPVLKKALPPRMGVETEQKGQENAKKIL